jgi:hypothetical protein
MRVLRETNFALAKNGLFHDILSIIFIEYLGSKSSPKERLRPYLVLEPGSRATPYPVGMTGE